VDKATSPEGSVFFQQNSSLRPLRGPRNQIWTMH